MEFSDLVWGGVESEDEFGAGDALGITNSGVDPDVFADVDADGDAIDVNDLAGCAGSEVAELVEDPVVR